MPSKSTYRVSGDMLFVLNRPTNQSLKSEYRNPKSETISNYKNPNDRNKIVDTVTPKRGLVFVIDTFEFRICFGFRASNFEITKQDHPPLEIRNLEFVNRHSYSSPFPIPHSSFVILWNRQNSTIQHSEFHIPNSITLLSLPGDRVSADRPGQRLSWKR